MPLPIPFTLGDHLGFGRIEISLLGSGQSQQAAWGRRPQFCRRFTLGSSFTEWGTVMDQIIHAETQHIPWNKGKLVGQKAPLKLKEIWVIRIRLQLGNRTRELALFNLAIDSKLRACDLVKLRVRDVCHGNVAAARAIVMQQKTQRPVQFEITEQTRESLLAWIRAAGLRPDDYLFPSRIHGSPHLSTRQYPRIVLGWIQEVGLDSSAYGTHTMRRTKASLIYRRTKNLRVVQLLLGHSKLESTVRYLGIEVDDALEMAESRRRYRSGPQGGAQGRAPPGQKRSFGADQGLHLALALNLSRWDTT
jgi:Phage integrase family